VELRAEVEVEVYVEGDGDEDDCEAPAVVQSVAEDGFGLGNPTPVA
jgi:hypothetical protein